MDKAGKNYWNDSWAMGNLPHAMNPADTSLDNFVNRSFHSFFVDLFDGLPTRSLRLLEVGCANSVWLPYFANEYGFEVSGLDYSPIGCQMTTHILNSSAVKAQIVCADLFTPPQTMLKSYDVIVSFGVVEHFEDTSACIRAISALLKPGGILVTSVPNMVGWIGALQRFVNEPIYNIHKPIDSVILSDSHSAAGLVVAKCQYFMFTNFGVANLAGVSTNNPVYLASRIFLAILARISRAIWILEGKAALFRPNKLTSPYVICVARKP